VRGKIAGERGKNVGGVDSEIKDEYRDPGGKHLKCISERVTTKVK